MERFYVKPEGFGPDRVRFSAGQVKYIRKVLRLQEGAEVAVTNGLGQAYLCRLRFLSREEAVGSLVSPLREDNDPGLKVVLYQGIPKGDKMDQVVQKSVELGVAEIVPLITRRCVVRLEGGRMEERRQRWQRIAASALEQSRRNFLPPVREPLSLASALQEGRGDSPGGCPGGPGGGSLAFMPWEEEQSLGLWTFLEANPFPREVRVFIGPEGGFTREEAAKAAAAGVARVTLGKRILRTETAGPAVLAMALYHYGELGRGERP